MNAGTIIIAGALLLAPACATLPEDYPKTFSSALGLTTETELGALALAEASRHEGLSGYALIADGRTAFTSRIALADLADKSIDAQYYIWDSDAAGKILAERLVRAADRGVRVRVIIDDLATSGRDQVLATLDAHPNVEIRVFNPFAHRDARTIDFLSDLGRVNHRMHNKTIVFDNAVSIVGGRNVADIYFQVSGDANYRDLDVAAAGPIVPTISNVFDHFWNGVWTVPISAFADRTYTQSDLAAMLGGIRDQIAATDFPYPVEAKAVALEESLSELVDEFTWAPGRIVWDDPADINKGRISGDIMQGLAKKLDGLESELLVESAYFVVPASQVERIGDLVDSGVRVRVLTNSLESNDVIAAHAGHAAHRKDLIAEGVELYELKADAETVEKRLFPMRSRAALHTKAAVFDQSSIFVGSFNFDPRSATINTEAGLYIESPDLARKLETYMEEGIQTDSAYLVQLDEDGDLVWTTEIEGELVSTKKEPGTSFRRRLMIGLINFLPIERLL